MQGGYVGGCVSNIFGFVERYEISQRKEGQNIDEMKEEGRMIELASFLWM